MYGKTFSKMYQGSMVGAGCHVFAVWGFCISCADPEAHTVDLNPKLLATILGDTEERINEAIAYLAKPDPNSHCQEHQGARLVHQTGYEYFLVTHEQYRNMKNNEELRAYFRETKRAQRMSKNVQDSPKTPAYAYASEDGDTKGKITSDFDAFWTAYPRKTGKKAAFKAWRKATDKPALDVIIKAIEARKQTEQWRKDHGQFIPHPATWLNQGRWDDEVAPISKPRIVV